MLGKTQRWSQDDNWTQVTVVTERGVITNDVWLYINNYFYRYLYYRRYYVFFEHPIWIDFWGCCCSHGNIVHYVLTDPCFSIMTGPAIAYIFPRPDFSMPFNVWGPRQSGEFPFWPLGYKEMDRWGLARRFTILLFGWSVILQGCSFIVNGAKLSLDNGGIGERWIFFLRPKKGHEEKCELLSMELSFWPKWCCSKTSNKIMPAIN